MTSLTKSLIAVGFRYHGLSEKELQTKRCEEFIKSIRWLKPLEAGCADMINGFDWDMRELLEVLMPQDLSILPAKCKWHKCVAAGSYFQAVDDNMCLRGETMRVMEETNWRVPIKIKMLKAVVRTDKVLCVIFVTDRQTHPMFELFPHLNVVVQPHTNYMFEVCQGVVSHDYYVHGQIWITPFGLV